MDNRQRYDMYAFIHKGLRLGMCECLRDLSTVDPLDDVEFDEITGKVLNFLNLCLGHVHHENDFVHRAMEARKPYSSQPVAFQHVEHLKQINQLQHELVRIQLLPILRRSESLHRYYREFALWMTENFIHMEQEETENNAILWSCYSDAELIAIEQELVASISPSMMLDIQSLMIRAMTPAERAGFLGAVREAVTASEFSVMVEQLGDSLGDSHYRKLQTAVFPQSGPLNQAV